MLTKIQKQRFKGFTGVDFTFSEKQGQCISTKPFNNLQWKGSPWLVVYVVDEQGNLLCELNHRLTNNRITGWNKEGVELDKEHWSDYFEEHW